MKKNSFLSFIILIVGFSQTLFAQCDSTLWNHVYYSYRLAVHNSCITVSGTVYSLIYEADGDIHIRVTLDSPYIYMLNSVNYSGQYGKLVCEPVCATTCTQADAIASCAGFTNTVFIPAVGEHVLVTGSYVTDNYHGWNELHPVTSILIGSGVGLKEAAPETIKPDLSVFPNPATTKVTFQLSKAPSEPVFITISDGAGRLAGQYQMFDMLHLDINTKYLPTGKYNYHVREGGNFMTSGSFIVLK